MLRKVLHSKIHQATVTAARPDYVGSITIDRRLLDATGMRVSDAVTVANCRNGERFETYIFLGEAGSGKIEVNGAAAHLVEPGDKVYGGLIAGEHNRDNDTIYLGTLRTTFSF